MRMEGRVVSSCTSTSREANDTTSFRPQDIAVVRGRLIAEFAQDVEIATQFIHTQFTPSGSHDIHEPGFLIGTSISQRLQHQNGLWFTWHS